MDLYTETILDHYEHPHHTGTLASPDVHVAEYNLLCGDRIELDCAFTNKGAIADVAFVGSGCALSQAGMSILSDWSIGKSRNDIAALSHDDVQSMIGSPITPARLKCALLGLGALKRIYEPYHSNS
ncbi:iron-sulfur cluster assembly scaffold protein [Candidatus Uhrbacteria bacterium]|nr:iron-sulfur cluster assembly scaffold protein [Candidatus Uhrbacteria bacterium]